MKKTSSAKEFTWPTSPANNSTTTPNSNRSSPAKKSMELSPAPSSQSASSSPAWKEESRCRTLTFRSKTTAKPFSGVCYNTAQSLSSGACVPPASSSTNDPLNIIITYSQIIIQIKYDKRWWTHPPRNGRRCNSIQYLPPNPVKHNQQKEIANAGFTCKKVVITTDRLLMF